MPPKLTDLMPGDSPNDLTKNEAPATEPVLNKDGYDVTALLEEIEALKAELATAKEKLPVETTVPDGHQSIFLSSKTPGLSIYTDENGRYLPVNISGHGLFKVQTDVHQVVPDHVAEVVLYMQKTLMPEKRAARK